MPAAQPTLLLLLLLLLLLGPAAAAADPAPPRYPARAYFDAARLFNVTRVARRAPPQLLAALTGVRGFNAALGVLGPRLRARLPGRPAYVLAVRVGADQCREFGGGARAPGAGRGQTAAYLLRADLALAARPALRLVLAPPERDDSAAYGVVHAGDARWHSVGGEGEALLLSFVTYVGDSAQHNWAVGEAGFEPRARGATAVRLRALGRFASPAGPAVAVRGRNYNVWPCGDAVCASVWAGVQQTPGDPAAAPASAEALADGRRVRLLSAVEDERLYLTPWLPHSALHSNGIMLPVGPQYLSVVHGHLSDHGGGARYGSHYLHYFVLLDGAAPFGLVAQSPPFCLPSAVNAALCDVVQFVMSLVPAHNHSDALLMTYGVNDCDSFVVRLSLSNVLAFTLGRAPQLVLQ
jgi:hypothetical protein